MHGSCSREWTASASGPFVQMILKGNRARSAFPGLRHLSHLSKGGWWHSAGSSSLLVLSCAKTFDTAAILRDGGAKTTNNCSLSGRILRILLGRNGVATLGSSGNLFFERTFRNWGANINSSARNTSPIPWQYRCKCSYTTLLHILMISLCIY